jgi:SAM-dependent methyltransferase
MTAMTARVRRLFYELRTEGGGAGREAAAVGVGVFIGCLPFFGFHLLLCWISGWLFRLNRVKMYLAANISNPLFATTLVFVELQLGAWFRRGAFHELTLEAARTTELSVFGLDTLTGSLLVGGTLGLVLSAATYATLRGSTEDMAFLDLVREASDRYTLSSITAWEFARGKLRRDPLYRAAVCDGLLPSGGTLVDIGCGQGLTLALLADASRRFQAGQWPRAWHDPPQYARLIGVETRKHVADLARLALGADAEIIHGDARTVTPECCRAVLCFDVLHLMPISDQEGVIAATAAALEPGGVMLVREADAAAGWRFAAVRFVNRFKALAFGAWRQREYFRTAEEWLACFATQGLHAEVRPVSEGTPFANVLFLMSRRDHVTAPVSGSNDPPAPAA